MRLVFTFLFMLMAIYSFTQSWNEVQKESIVLKDVVDISVENARTYYVNDDNIKKLLWDTPNENEVLSGEAEAKLIAFPLANGNIDHFFVFRYDMMQSELAKKYDDIRTFIGVSRNQPDRKIRIDYTLQGVRAVIRDDQGMTYIDHFQRNDKSHRIVYRKADFQTDEKVNCEFGLEKPSFSKEEPQSTNKLLGNCELRTYRYAQTTTGEYSNFHGATSAAQSALVMSAVVTTMNRVNEVYEQDLTVRFILINNTDDIFYYNAGTDPFNGSNASNMISVNQTNTDNVIGSANYDIGHIFSTGGSGLAGLGVVCINGNKARGVTGIGTPAGDPFDIDYVSHEIGHQCGGNHTQNNSCQRSGTSVEVGSGFTIMGYAGICNPNVLNNSIAMFNTANIVEMSNYLDSRTCHNTISLTNTAPVAQFIEDKIIPISTPFILDVEVSDPDSDPLFHAWEQQDATVGTMPPLSTNTGGPVFRSYLPTSEKQRFYPSISNYAQGISNTWEVLPSVARDMNFVYTARDISFAAGCIDTSNVKITVEGGAGPFDVTSQASSLSYSEYENVLIMWDVANTDVAPINAQLVDILYSRDGGLTYPDTLVKQTLNDGAREIVIPQGLENDARFMVKAADNYFFDINDANITVTNSSASFDISIDKQFESFCTTEINPFVINIDSESFEGFSADINLSLQGVPSGVTATLADFTINAGNSTTLTLENFNIPAGQYVIEILASESGLVRKEEFVLDIIDTNSSNILLTSPADAAFDVMNNPELEWQAVAGVNQYEYQIMNFVGTVIESGIVSNNTVVPNTILNVNQTFSWQVRPIFDCGNGNFSNPFTFSTGSCLNFEEREDVIIPNTISTVNSTIDIPFTGTVTDVNIKNLDITHTWIEDLEVTLGDPAGNSAILYDHTCGQDDDIFLTYDDDGSPFDCAQRTSGSTVAPVQNLSTFNAMDLNGVWDLEIHDEANQDGGILNSWTLEICFTGSCELNVSKLNFDDGTGSLKEALDCATSGDVITFDNSLPTSAIINLASDQIIIDKNLTFSVPSGKTVRLIGDGLQPSLEVMNSGTFTANNMTISNLTTNVMVVKNEGVMNINNVSVLGNTTATKLDNSTGVLNASGTNVIANN